MVETLAGACIHARHLNVQLQPIDRPTLCIVFERWLSYTEAKGQPTALDTAKLEAGL